MTHLDHRHTRRFQADKAAWIAGHFPLPLRIAKGLYWLLVLCTSILVSIALL